MIYAITPVPKPRMTRRDKWLKRPCVMIYRRFKDQVQARRVELPQPCEVIFTIEMPESWPEATRAKMNGKPHTARPDLDNLLKALCDAVHQEDSHIHDVRAQKRWGRAGMIEVRRIEKGK